MTLSRVFPRVAFVVLLLSGVSAQTPAPPPSAGGAPPARVGYLPPDIASEFARVVPPPPRDGDAKAIADLAIFRATRAMEGSPRWMLATSDDNVSVAGLMSVFSCAVGVTLTAGDAPRVQALLARANVDAVRTSTALKQLYERKRPYQVEEGNVCVSDRTRDALARQSDYPSGHTTSGWEAGLVLASLAPDATAAILGRARAFGESRIVCGVHNATAVEAGMLVATTVFAAQGSVPAFREDLEAARAELSALRAAAVEKPASCAAEDALQSRPF